MAFSRNSLAAAVAGTLSLAVLTGCPAPTAPVASPSAAPTTGTPSAAPTTTPGESAAPTTAPVASQAPNANASPSNLTPTTLRGKVYDEDGATLNSGAQVTVKSLNPSNPFESTVDVISGNYVVNNVPAGVQLEITAKRTGWTTRTRVETLLPLTSTQPNIVNFGAASYATGATQEDPEGVAYFISERPEITSVVPADDAENVDPTKLSVVLTLSEPLDTTNQNRFANALRVVPANNAASDDGAATPVSEEATGVLPTFDYVIEEGVTFLGEDATRATVTWDAAGQVATLTFNAPLISSDTDAADYQILLVAQTSAIEDADGNELGDGAAGEFLANTFREEDLAIGTGNADVWAATHQTATTFSLAEDDTDPQLTAVSVVELSGTSPVTRIQLTFSEPMAAYSDALTGYSSPTLTNGSGLFTFAVAEDIADLTDVELDGTGALVGSPAAENVNPASVTEESEFRLVDNNGTVNVSVSPTDAKVVRIEISGTTIFDDFNAIKARVEGVEDPAGNAITETQADAQEKTGNI
jgi:hypothetical protein